MSALSDLVLGGANQGETDPLWDDVVFLFQPTSTDTTFDDLSDSAHTITNNSSVTLSTTTPIAGLKSANFNGSNYLSMTDSPDWDFGTADFCIDAYVYFNALGGQRMILGRNSTVWPEFYEDSSGSNFLTVYFDSASRTSSQSVTTGAWYFCSIERVSGVSRLYVDGTQVLSYSTDLRDYNGGGNAFNLGKDWTAIDFFNGLMTMVRVTKNSRYKGTHVVPTDPFPTQ